MLSDGETIGAYVVVSQLGHGGMGTVYLGKHALLGRKAAIKVLNPAVSTDDEVVQRFFNEARAVTQISDPGIVQIFDYGHHTDGSAFIVMELLEGSAMDDRIEALGRFQVADFLLLIRMICTSLAAAHAKGIVHRDLKPENIFIVPDPAVTGGERAKILDFGIAKLQHDEVGTLRTQTGFVMGTPVYMSPEQCRGAEVDHRSDIYSIGCVMFSMLTGRPPFDEPSAAELIAAHLREPAPYASAYVPDVPDEVDQILQRCLAKAPEDRFQSMTDLVAALDDADVVVFGAVREVVYAGGEPSAKIRPRVRLVTPAAGTRRAPTPVSGVPVQTTTRPSMKGATPTTMTRASGQQTAVERPRGRGWIVGVVVAAGMVIGASVVLMHGGDGSSSAPLPATPVTRPVVTPDAAQAAVTVPIPTPDAAVVVDAPIDAPNEAPTAVDAGHKLPDRPLPGNHVVHPPTTRENSHAQQPTGSGSATHVDRGD